MNTQTRVLYKTAADFWELLDAGKITFDERNMASQIFNNEIKESQSRTYIVPIPIKINRDRCTNMLQNPQSQIIVPTEITKDECESPLQSSQSRTNIVPIPIMINRYLCISVFQSRTIIPREITKDECNSMLQSSQSPTNLVPLKIAKDKSAGLQNLQCRKRLCLVLDLDHTLIHTEKVCNLAPEKAKMCLDNVAHKDDMFTWKYTTGSDRLIKVRPFVREFLEEANKLFEMYIYTMGTRDYALHIADLLDPKSIYFGSRIISRENCTVSGQKGLDVVPVDESGILIIDDTMGVWFRHISNLIVIDKYDYFTSLSKDGMDESDSAGPLSRVLKLLQEVHSLYFGQHQMLDVRVLLGMVSKRRCLEESN
ncbi:hypothetical protein AgCh_037062 [Apium graveolens]